MGPLASVAIISVGASALVMFHSEYKGTNKKSIVWSIFCWAACIWFPVHIADGFHLANVAFLKVGGYLFFAAVGSAIYYCANIPHTIFSRRTVQ